MTERTSLQGPPFCNHFWALLSFVAVVLMRTQEMFIFPSKETHTNCWYLTGLVAVRCRCWTKSWLLLPCRKLLWQPGLMDGHWLVICLSVLVAGHAKQALQCPRGAHLLSASRPCCPRATQSSPSSICDLILTFHVHLTASVVFSVDGNHGTWHTRQYVASNLRNYVSAWRDEVSLSTETFDSAGNRSDSLGHLFVS